MKGDIAGVKMSEGATEGTFSDGATETEGTFSVATETEGTFSERADTDVTAGGHSLDLYQKASMGQKQCWVCGKDETDISRILQNLLLYFLC